MPITGTEIPANGRWSISGSLGPDPEDVAGRIAEVEPTAAGELEDRLDDLGAGRLDAGQRGFEVARLEDDQRRGAGRRRGAEPAGEPGAVHGRVLRSEVGERPAEGAGIELL